MSDAYREMPDVLGEGERESEAIRVFGRWRDRTRLRVLAIAAVIGLVPGALAYYFVQELQFHYNHGRAMLIANVGATAIGWGIVFAIGAFVARKMLRAKTGAKLAELAKSYDVPIEKLKSISDMVEKL